MSAGWWGKVKSDPVLRERDRKRQKCASAKYQKTIRGRTNYYKGNAKRSGLAFELPLELCNDLMTDNCYYCGVEPSPYNGIDRVDNSRGYLEDNVVTACEMCNLSKKDWTKEEFEAWIIRAASHLERVA